MAVGDKMVLTVIGQNLQNTQQIVNVFAYTNTTTAGSCADLITAWQSEIQDNYLGVLSNFYLLTQINAINLDNTLDFATVAAALNGTRSGQVMPSFVCWEFMYVRADRAAHNGRKSIGVVSEDDVTNGTVTPSFAATVNGLATAMGAILTTGGSAPEFTPAIWRRAGNYGTPPVAYPDTFYPVASVVYRRVSSQNTRKTGRGA